jgi:hypothetical protein
VKKSLGLDEERGVQVLLEYTSKGDWEWARDALRRHQDPDADCYMGRWTQSCDSINNLGVHTGRGGRIDADLTVPSVTCVYALGDFANITGKDGVPLPQLASVAEQSGKCCARNILLEIAGEPRAPFHYLDKGIMAIIGRSSGVAEVGEHRLSDAGRNRLPSVARSA